MSKEIDIYEFYDKMERENIMLSFKGDMTTDLLSSILQIIERKLESIEDSAKLRRKVFNIAVECLQNLYHHISKDQEGDSEHNVMVMIGKNDEGYSVVTGNFVTNDNVDSLKQSLEKINSLSRDELKKMYQKVLNNGQRTSQGGGGLGIIDIARKSGEKLEYDFINLDDANSFFSLNVKVSG